MRNARLLRALPGLEAVGIGNPDKVLDDFWNAALSRDKVSARFMRDSDATIEEVDGKRIVVIRVPWANRHSRPVYIDDDLFGGTFRRTHTGDHLCSREEVLSMLRDADTSSQDAGIVHSAKLEFINRETVRRYRMRSDPRNETMMKMLAMVEIGERAGSGMDKIFQGWGWAGYVRPSYDVEFGPDRTALTLPLVSAGDSSSDSSSGQDECTNRVEESDTRGSRKEDVLAYLGTHGAARRAEVADALGLSASWTSRLLSELVTDGKVVSVKSSASSPSPDPDGQCPGHGSV